MRSLLYLAALLSLLNATLASPVSSGCLLHPDSGVDASGVNTGTVLDGVSLSGSNRNRHGESAMATVAKGTTDPSNMVSGVIGTGRTGSIVNGLSVDSTEHDSMQDINHVSSSVSTSKGSSGVGLGTFQDPSEQDSTKADISTQHSTDRTTSDSTGVSLMPHGKSDGTGITLPGVGTGSTGSALGRVLSTGRNGLNVGANPGSSGVTVVGSSTRNPQQSSEVTVDPDTSRTGTVSTDDSSSNPSLKADASVNGGTHKGSSASKNGSKGTTVSADPNNSNSMGRSSSVNTNKGSGSDKGGSCVL